LPISGVTEKILWGRAAGICSNPACKQDLIEILRERGSYHIGEMAHIIARSSGGPRADSVHGSDDYENLILLCPTCHTRIDKAPELYPEELLRRWKDNHEIAIRQRGRELHFPSSKDLKNEVCRLLAENRSVWMGFGPHSLSARTDPHSNMHIVWNLKKLNTIIPNNRTIINIIESNLDLIGAEEKDLFAAFKNHAAAFETNQYHRLDSYPLFPVGFEERFCA
jgi:hypothetical protein